MRSVFFRSFAALALLVCVSCVKAPETARIPADAAAGKALWERFASRSARMENTASPFRLNATLYYTGKEDSQRVSAYFWGNFAAADPYPLRLDILMGSGNVVAITREDARGIFIYVPREETVYHAEDDGLLAFGVPLPFKLSDLAALVTGRFLRVFSPEDGEPPSAFAGENGAIGYPLENAPLAGFITIAENGLPIAWEDGIQNGWRLTIDYWPDSTRRTPRKLHIKHLGEKREATLITRELAAPEKPFTSQELDLNVPLKTRLAPLDGAR